MNDIRGRTDDSLTTEYAWTVGKAFAEWLPEQGAIVVARGENTNETTAHALIEGLLLQGRDIIDAGQGVHQTLVDAIVDKKAAGGVLFGHDDLQAFEIIALYDAQGASVTTDTGLMEISQLVEAGNFIPAADKGEIKPLA